MSSAVVGAGSVLSGRYRLVEPLASGGMGTVWRALDLLLDRPVAVKEVRLPPGLDDESRTTLRRRTIREAQVAARLRHSAIVTIFDVVEQDGRPWIVMELVPSRSLAEIIRTTGPLPPVRVAAIGLRVLDAMVAAAAAGVEHRDIKPANVLVTNEGRVVLTDFGIARHTGDESLTSAGLIVGSPDYLAPERARGRSGGLAADLWSLGATIYDAVEGRRPFERDGALPTLAAVVMDEPDPPVRAGPLRPIIDGLLVKNPAHRLGADQTRIMLERVLRGRPAGGTVPLPRRPFEAPFRGRPVPPPPVPTSTWEDLAPTREKLAATLPEQAAAGAPTTPQERPAAQAQAPVQEPPAATPQAPVQEPPAAQAQAPVQKPPAATPQEPAAQEPAAQEQAPPEEKPAARLETGPPVGAPAAQAQPATTPQEPVAADVKPAAQEQPALPFRAPPATVHEPVGLEDEPGARQEPETAPAWSAGSAAVDRQGRTSSAGELATVGAAGAAAGGQASEPPGAGAATTPAADRPWVGTGREAEGGGDAPGRRRAVLAGLALLVLAGVAAVLVPLLRQDGDPRATGPAGTAAPTARTTAAAPGAGSEAGSQPPATGASTGPGASPGRSGNAAPPPNRTAAGNPPPTGARVAVPAGFTRYTDPRDGFSVIVPAGWTPIRRDTRVDFDDPSSSRFLRIDTSDTPLPDPYQNWIDYERQFRQGKTSYHKIYIRRVPDYRPEEGWTTADWEFTLGGTHVLDRNIRVSDARAHAIYWSTPESLWNTPESRRILQLAEQSFVPAPVGR